MAMQHLPVFKVRGRVIRQDDDGMVCVTDIHKASGFTKNQRPVDFSRLPQALTIMAVLHEKLVGKSHQFKTSRVWRTKSGPSGGTFAHPVLALAYSEYLSPKLAIEVREVFLRHKAGDPSLADETLQRASSEANEWVAHRALGRVVRNSYTRQLDGRGVKGMEFGICTNQTYVELFDKTASQLKAARKIAKSMALRDKMTGSELAYVAASESLSIERMTDEDSAGFGECRNATAKASRAIRRAIEEDRRDRQRKIL